MCILTPVISVFQKIRVDMKMIFLTKKLILPVSGIIHRLFAWVTLLIIKAVNGFFIMSFHIYTLLTANCNNMKHDFLHTPEIDMKLIFRMVKVDITLENFGGIFMATG